MPVYPGAFSFVGLSAGTTVVVYALEQLPQDAPVDNVVLCGASISSTYDLTRALRNVKGKIYVFTSEKDSVLGFLVPMAGTADRASGNVPSAGLRGFRMPRGATTDTRQQYAKVVTIPWRHEFAKLGYRGGHTDVLSARFVAAHIAPRLTQHIGSTPRALASTRGKVRNPDYERWADFGVGSFVVLEGHQEFQGKRTPVRLRSILMRKSADRLLIERQQYLAEGDGEIPEQIHSLIAEAWIDPRHHPTTDPTARITERPARRVSIGGRVFNCNGMSIAAPGEYPDWGSNVKATPYRCTDLPGGLVELELESHLQGQPFKFSGKVVRFNIVPDSDGK